MKTLHLILKKKWFDMIISGEKKEEYRDLTNHWRSRLLDNTGNYKNFDTITFTNGYAKTAPRFIIEFQGIYEGFGVESWGASPNKSYYVIQLGDILAVSRSGRTNDK